MSFKEKPYMKVFGDGEQIGLVCEKWYSETCPRLIFEYQFSNSGKHVIEVKHTQEQGDYPLAHWTTVDAIDVDGELVETTTIPQTQLKPVLTVEQPVTGTTYTGTLPLSGYALNQSVVKEVKVYVDDKYSKNTNIGIARTDVVAKYPGYPGASTSGFSTTYNASDFTVGNHTMKVQAIGKDGTTQEAILYLYAYNTNIIVRTTPIVDMVPLFRYSNANGSEHFYTTDFKELGQGAMGWYLEGVQCFVYSSLQPGTVPLYRYSNATGSKHFYTTDFKELGQGAMGWYLESKQCYVYSSLQPGTVALKRYSNADGSSHFYTTEDEGAVGWYFEANQCYVVPSR